LIITVNTYLFKYVPVKLGFIILSLIGVLRIPEEFYLYKDKDKVQVHRTNNVTQTVVPLESLL
jgi:putative Mn2+ efflux pump MntP